MSEIDIIIPTYGRASAISKLRKNIAETTETPYVITFVAEEDDEKTVKELKGDEEAIITTLGSALKAVNHAFSQCSAPYFIFANDDFNFQPGWDTNALAKMNDRVHVVALHDGNPGEPQWGTICLVKRSYVNDHGGTENKGEVFHEGYSHYYCDTEFFERATLRGMTDTAPEAKIIHEHPSFGFKGDALHKKKGMERDSQIWQSRRREYL